MLDQVYVLFFILIFAFPLGYATERFSKWLDASMNWGNIFDFMRYAVIYHFAKDKIQFKKDFKKAISVDIDERISEVDRVYRIHAVKKSRGYLCPHCFGTQILIVICISTVIVLKLDWYMFIPLMFFSYITFEKD